MPGTDVAAASWYDNGILLLRSLPNPKVEKSGQTSQKAGSAMPVPETLIGRLRIPVIAAPMFLVSGPELVVEACRAGVVGTFPSLNARTTAELEEWLTGIREQLSLAESDPSRIVSPFGVNLIVHRTDGRLAADLDALVRHKVPLVITSLGSPQAVVGAVHSYGGVVFHDVIMATHARKAIAAGVDGIIGVGSGAGGHAGTQSLVSLIREIRAFWDGTLIAAGAIGDGYSVRAAEVLGADFAYVGTRFIATRESRARPEYKAMLVEAQATDIVYTDGVSGVHGNFLAPSLERAGVDAHGLRAGETPGGEPTPLAEEHEAKAWKDVWSAGHAVSTIHDVPTVADLVSRLREEYDAACRLPRNPALR